MGRVASPKPKIRHLSFFSLLITRREFPDFSLDSPSEAIVTLVRATDFKSVGGCGNTTSAGSIPVRFRHTGFEDPPSPLLPRVPSGASKA